MSAPKHKQKNQYGAQGAVTIPTKFTALVTAWGKGPVAPMMELIVCSCILQYEMLSSRYQNRSVKKDTSTAFLHDYTTKTWKPQAAFEQSFTSFTKATNSLRKATKTTMWYRTCGLLSIRTNCTNPKSAAPLMLRQNTNSKQSGDNHGKRIFRHSWAASSGRIGHLQFERTACQPPNTSKKTNMVHRGL